MRALVLALAVTTLLVGCNQPPAENVEVADEAEAPQPSRVSVSDPWAGATPDGAQAAAGYMVVANSGPGDDRIVSATSPRAKAVELHQMSMEGGAMTMRQIEGGIDVPVGGELRLEPGGMHLMFIGLDAPFKEGEEVPVTLKFERAGDVPVTLAVRQRGGHDGGR